MITILCLLSSYEGHVASAAVQSAEELDKQRLEAQQKRDADMKQERADRAKKNAELLAKQKVCTRSMRHTPLLAPCIPMRLFAP